MPVQTRHRTMPGPAHVPLVGWQARAVRLLADPIGFLTRTHARYGEISTSSPGRPRHVFVFGADAHRELFSQPEVFIADAFRELRMSPRSAMARLTAGLLKLNGETHRQHRRLMQPAFHSRAVGGYLQSIVDVTERELARLAVGQELALDRAISRLTLLIGMKSIFGIDSPAGVDHLNDLMTRLLAAGGAPTTLLLPVDLPGTSYRRAMRTAEAIDAELRRMIEARRAAPAPGSDILSTLVFARDEDGLALGDDELIAEAYTAFCHESSAASLCWTLFLLDQHPAVLAALRAELDRELGGGPPDLAQLERLPVLDQVVKESLRLFPPAAFGLRYAATDARLGGYDVPPDATVFFSQYVSHRLPEVFAEPLRFDPQRWASLQPSVYEYLPFGAGPHNCLGRAFALLEIKVILAMLVPRFRLRLRPGARLDRTVKISLTTRNGFPVRVAPPDDAGPPAPVAGNVHESVLLAGRDG